MQAHGYEILLLPAVSFVQVSKVASEINLHPLTILNGNALSFDKFYKHKYKQKHKIVRKPLKMVLTMDQKNLILWRLGQNNPNYRSLEIVREVGFSERTVCNWRRRWLEERSLKCRPRPRRPKKTNEEQDMKTIEAGIFFKWDRVTTMMEKIRTMSILKFIEQHLIGDF
jgi:hypothetical protein